MAGEMNGKSVIIDAPAVRHANQRRKRGTVPKGGRAALSPKERELHAQLRADGRLKSGRSGGYDYYVVNGKQRWRRHSVPKDPRTPAQQRARARFAAASKMWSEDGPMTEGLRNAWCANGAKKQSRPRLGQSGPLTGQQDFIGRNCARKQRGSGMLLDPLQRERTKPKNKEDLPELMTQVFQSQPFTRSTAWPCRAITLTVLSYRRVPRGYLRKIKVRQLVLQVPRLQSVTRSTSDRPQTSSRVLPWQCR